MTSSQQKNLTIAIASCVAVLLGLAVVFGLLRGGGPDGRGTSTNTVVVEPTATPAERTSRPEARVSTAPDRTSGPVATSRAPLTVTVIDAGSRDPIPGTTVQLRQGMNIAATQVTNAQGVTAFEGIAPGDYALFAQWGPGVDHPGGNVGIVAGETLQRIIEYPARTRYAFRFVNEETKQAAAAREIIVRLPDTRAVLPQPGFELKATTDAAGRLRFWAYPDLRPVYFSIDGIAQLTREGENRWLNPYDYRAPLGFEDEGVLRIREEVVQVTGRLINPPEVSFGEGFVANALSPRADYRGLPVVDKQFRFTAAPGSTYNISLVRPGPEWSPSEGTEVPENLQAILNAAVEKRVTITPPEDPGTFEFDIEFEDRTQVRGRVLNPDGSPAPGQLVRARGFGEQDSSRTFANVRTGQGTADFLSEPTDSSGRFFLEVPPAKEYTFMISTLNPIQDAKRMDSVTVPWERLFAGEEVVLQIAQPAVMWGYVVDEGGAPVARASVSLRGSRLPPAWERFGVATDEEGFFMMTLPENNALQAEGIALGDIYAVAHRQGVGRGMAPAVVNDPENPVKITMFGTTMVRIRATNGGEFVERLNVSFVFDTPEFASEVFGAGTRTLQGRRGLFQLQNVPKGITKLAVSDESNAVGPIIEIPIPATAPFPYEVKIDFKNDPRAR